MFNLVHENKKWVQIVLALIILPFAFWGVDSYNQSGNRADAVATVNGTEITQQEFEDALRQQQDRLRQALGANFDAAMLESPEVRHNVMDNLVAQRLLVERAKAAGLTVSDAQVAQIIQGIEAFQDNGKFDKKRYGAALANQNMSPLMFEARLRSDLAGQQMRDAYVQNGFASNNVADNIIRLNEQQRVVSVSPISLQPFMGQAKVGENALKTYYEQNLKEFQVQEQVKVEYVKLSVDNLLPKAEVNMEDARKYYEEHQRDFGTPEERQAAHILIAVAATAPQAEQDAAKAKAEQLLQQAKKNPAEFAALAKQNSQDPGSAVNGGDLGFFGHGMMVGPFEDAAFALKQGEISDLVKSDFGYHIIKLLAVKPAKLLSFDEAREDILRKLRQQKATDMFAELAEKFSNTVYEQSDTLKPAADLAGVKIEQSGWLIKGMAAGEPWTEKMLQAVFSDGAVKDKRNTGAIEVAANTLVAARVLEHKPAAVRALDEVQETIRGKLLRGQAAELAVKQGRTLLEQLQRGDKPALNWATAQTVTRAKFGTLDRDMVRKIFQADATRLPQFIGAETPQDGYVLVRIESVKEGGKLDGEKRNGYVQQLRKLTGEEMFRAYLADARQQASINVMLSDSSTPASSGK
ncbi:MAG: peptidylprolyl isomerase [Gallionellales bacterium RIFCSPLOWO2_12_FULL_59_22]|nr:MAG: peptidylprolyl isomerase [Gallionellales bacterium RIFCSPLOWO2_02_FULL_59_110]OGT05594.1 MAG: peptidylprolyl isomerase [Gallionellales bacterium RIFCSPLOWO2_02_58_13]OGT14737.1 MAG: peptidylprolyl isomerase [Gallionellales bacterium RIFCSPLOWO2_12_FULL_59_22]